MAAGDGLVSMAPTSIAYSGTSAGINADGGVDFSAVTSLSLNGVFTSDYDNYLIVFIGKTSIDGYGLSWKLRASGTDTTDSNYARQYVQANSTTVAGGRATGQSSIGLVPISGIQDIGTHLHWYGPALAQATAGRSVTAPYQSLTDYAWTHSTATSYDGFSFTISGATTTGNLHVFGYEE
jgi:hypothetical protein